MSPPLVLVLHNSVANESPPDTKDVRDQAEFVRACLAERGFRTATLALDLDLATTARQLLEIRPDVVFNLVEAVADSGQLTHLSPALLEHLGLPYTGAGVEGMLTSSTKVFAKEMMAAAGVPTPDWWEPGKPLPVDPGGKWIVKPIWEDASVSMDDASVVDDFADVNERIRLKHGERDIGPWFAERFIAGREINVSIVGGRNGPQVLPVAEIEFRDYPPDKPRIVSYAAKWTEDSFEFSHTPRRFLDTQAESSLAKELADLTRRCWDLFHLRGFARVDYRVDKAGRPWVLEVNANPCISPDAGFAAAVAQAGMTMPEAIQRIVEDAKRPWRPT